MAPWLVDTFGDVTISWFETELRGDLIVVAERCRSCVEVPETAWYYCFQSFVGLTGHGGSGLFFPRLSGLSFLLLGETQATFMLDFSSSSCALYSLSVCEATISIPNTVTSITISNITCLTWQPIGAGRLGGSQACALSEITFDFIGLIRIVLFSSKHPRNQGHLSTSSIRFLPPVAGPVNLRTLRCRRRFSMVVQSLAYPVGVVVLPLSFLSPHRLWLTFLFQPCRSNETSRYHDHHLSPGYAGIQEKIIIKIINCHHMTRSSSIIILFFIIFIYYYVIIYED